MKNFLIYYVFIALSIIVNSCSEEGFEDSKIFIALKEVTAVTTPSIDSTPDYTFSSTESGTITYGGSCSSSTTSAISGNNIITLSSLSDGTYADCTITVAKTIIIEKLETIISDSLTITSFVVLPSYVAVGQSGKIITSSDGNTWNNRTSGTSVNLIGITYGNSKFLTLTGLMDNGTASPATVLTSANGTSWASTSATCSSCGTDNFSINDVTYGNSTYVAVGQSGKILTSSDGTSWDNRSSGTTSNLIGITYGNSKFLTLTGLMDNGTASPATVLTSDNGTSWASTSATCSSCGTDNVSINGVTYGNSTYVAVGDNATGAGKILTSDNGTSWTSRISGTTSSPIGITYGNSKFLTLTGTMDDGTDSPATVLTSANGTSWTSTSVTCSSCGSDNVSLNDFTYKE